MNLLIFFNSTSPNRFLEMSQHEVLEFKNICAYFKDTVTAILS